MTQLFITVGIMVSFLFGLAIPEAKEIQWDDPNSDWNKNFVNDPMV